MIRFMRSVLLIVALVGGLGASLVMAAGIPARASSTGTAPVATQPGMFVATAPTRLLDTRSAGHAPVPARGTVHLPLLGHGPVPASDVSAVVMTLVATAPAATGYLTAYADGATRPTASVLNFTAGLTVANLATVPVGSDGDVAIYNGSSGTTQVVVDITGYYLAGSPVDPGAYVATAPTRLLDTRRVGGSGVVANAVEPLHVAGAGPVPAAGFAAVVLNVTVTGPTQGGYLTVSADGIARPSTSNINFTAGQTVANAVTVAPGADGVIDLYNGSRGRADVVVDVLGYYLSGVPADTGAFVPVSPTRLVDTRTALGAAEPGGRAVVPIAVASHGSVPLGASAVLINLTAVSPQRSGYLTAYPTGTVRPTSSTMNFSATSIVATLATVRLGADGGIDLFNGSTAPVNVVGDVSGYFHGAPTGEVAPNPAAAIDVLPAPQGGSAAGCSAAPPGYVGRSAELTIGANISDPNVDGGPIRADFRVQDLGGSGTATPTDVIGFDDPAGQSSSTNASGGYVSIDVLTSSLLDGHEYAITEQTDDGVLTSASSAPCRFWLDESAPQDLTITAQQMTYQAGTPAVFTLSADDPAAPGTSGASGVDHFVYSLVSAADIGGDGGSHVPALPSQTSQRSASITFTPSVFGTNYLYVAAVDTAGNETDVVTVPFYVVG